MTHHAVAPHHRAVLPRHSHVQLCVSCWHERENRRLALLPFAASDLMLPGERRQLLLNRVAQIRMLERACNEDLGCFGQLLSHHAETNDFDATLGDIKNHHEQLVPLLQIMELRNPCDPGGVEGAVWVEVKCAGIAKLDTAPSMLWTPSKSGHRFLSADASCVAEQRRSHANVLRLRISEVREAVEACEAKERELMKMRGPSLRGPVRGKPRGEGRTTRLSYGSGSHHARATFDESFEDIVTERRQALLQNGLDEAPAGTLRALQPVWGIDCPLQAEASLFSWAAFAWLGGDVRLDALRSRSAFKRLKMARDALRQRERELATEIALEAAIGRAFESE